LQTPVAFAYRHGVVQLPQWAESDEKSDSQPSAALVLQSPNPALQAMLHLLAVQLGVPLVELHTVVQLPQ
jgi:hypothetical protein